MIAYPFGDKTRPDFLTPTAVLALRYILNADPDIQIVFSTSMRNDDESSSKLHRMWTSAGLDHFRVVGALPITGSLVVRREIELRDYIRTHREDFMLPIDDEILFNITYMKVDARTGLTMNNAHEVLRYFEGRNSALQASLSGFGMTRMSDQTDWL